MLLCSHSGQTRHNNSANVDCYAADSGGEWRLSSKSNIRPDWLFVVWSCEQLFISGLLRSSAMSVYTSSMKRNYNFQLMPKHYNNNLLQYHMQLSVTHIHAKKQPADNYKCSLAIQIDQQTAKSKWALCWVWRREADADRDCTHCRARRSQILSGARKLTAAARLSMCVGVSRNFRSPSCFWLYKLKASSCMPWWLLFSLPIKPLSSRQIETRPIALIA